jgi:hypothetical protein
MKIMSLTGSPTEVLTTCIPVWTIECSIPGRARDFTIRHRVQIGSEALPASCIVSSGGRGGSFPGAKRPGCETHHSLLSSVEIKNAWSYTSTAPYVFTAWCLIKHHVNIISASRVYALYFYTSLRRPVLSVRDTCI